MKKFIQKTISEMKTSHYCAQIELIALKQTVKEMFIPRDPNTKVMTVEEFDDFCKTL